MCEILAKVLSINDFDVAIAATGEEGLGLIAASHAVMRSACDEYE